MYGSNEKDVAQLINLESLSAMQSPGVPCVHCSAGVGRTGTYIAIDVILRRLRYIAAQPTFTEQQVLWAISIEQRASLSLLSWQQSLRLPMTWRM
jgi:protein tyrosine phosphatase